jgi:hypothetical protein
LFRHCRCTAYPDRPVGAVFAVLGRDLPREGSLITTTRTKDRSQRYIFTKNDVVLLGLLFYTSDNPFPVESASGQIASLKEASPT